MAILKETIKKQANEMIQATLQPGDQIVSGVYALTGPSPWLMAAAGPIRQLFAGYYYVAVTRRQCVFVKINRLSSRPKHIAFEMPAKAMRIFDVKRRNVWSSFRYQTPDVPKPRRLNVHHLWRDELDALIGAFGVPVG